MGSSHLVFLLGLALCIGTLTGITDGAPPSKKLGKQTWGYVEVRPGAFMFWWLYYTTGNEEYTKQPLVLWLQGGPGASSTGYGNFEEIGAVGVDGQNRTFSWVNYANVLFVDNPVGTGFSYVNDTSLLARNNTQIAMDLVELTSRFLQKVPEFQDVPLYIFSESYGGKMAAQFALRLHKQITKQKIKCNLKGVSLGDSWISPIDSVLTWAPYLFSTSLVDNSGFMAVNESAYTVKDAVDKLQFGKATVQWDKTESVIAEETNGVSFYNILETSKDQDSSSSSASSASKWLKSSYGEDLSSSKLDAAGRLAIKHLKRYHSDPLSTLMNGPVKDMLRVIPKNVTWGGQSAQVFQALSEDFMRPVTRIVESLLNNTTLDVNVYSGQLDLIVDTMGTMRWVERLYWPGISQWKKAPRQPIIINNSTEAFAKSYKTFAFYWILKAGHMVPMDAPATAADMLQFITGLKDRKKH